MENYNHYQDKRMDGFEETQKHILGRVNKLFNHLSELKTNQDWIIWFIKRGIIALIFGIAVAIIIGLINFIYK